MSNKSNEAYVYWYYNPETLEYYFGSRAAYSGSYKDDFNIKYFSSSKRVRPLAKAGKLIGEVIAVFRCSCYEETGKMAKYYEHDIIKASWEEWGKEKSYNKCLDGDTWNTFGLSLSEESKNKMIESNKNTWNSIEMKEAASERKKGVKASKETKRKMSISHKGKCANEKHYLYGKHHSEETRKKISEANSGENNGFYGKHHSEETRNRWSEIRKGKHPSEETRKKISEANSGENNGFYGKHHSEETKNKISIANSGKKRTEEVKNKMSIARKGKNYGRVGVFNPLYGKHHSEETKRKMSESQKGKHRPKYKWLTPEGNIVEMDKANATRFHSDWKLIS